MARFVNIFSLAAMLGVAASAAQAAPIGLPAGPVFFQFNNIEQLDTSGTNAIVVPGPALDVDGDGTADTPGNGLLGEGNWGVFNVSTMQFGAVVIPNEELSGGTPFFSDDGPGGTAGQVSGIFYNISLTGLTTATGGYMDVYWDDAGAPGETIVATDLAGTTFSPGARTDANSAGKFTDGTLMARLKFSPGIIPGDAVTTILSTTNIIGLTLPGFADSFADVVDINNDGVIDSLDGAWAPQLNGDWFFVDVDGDGTAGEVGETRDLRFSNFFNFNPNWDDAGVAVNGIVGLRSNDPGRVFAVPEPASLALVGMGLLALGVSVRRRRAPRSEI